jgi:flagellar hook-associated protein 1 FlgK
VSLFSTLNTASTALNAQQRAIDVTGQNVANVNTDGYSRQRVNMQSIAANAVPALWSVSNGVGGGVDASDVIRIRDAFLEAQGQQAHGAVSNLTVQDSSFTSVQQAFGEPGATGIQSTLNDFWSGWGDIHSNPVDDGARSQLLERAQTVVSGLHSAMGQLDQQWQESNDATQTLLTDVNSSTQQLASLNQAIQSASMNKLPTNELADKRDALVMHLSEQIGATSRLANDGSMTVSVGGISLVSGSNAIQLKLGGANNATDAATTPASILTSPGGAVVSVGGTALGQLTTQNSIIPSYEGQLNGVAQKLADEVNQVHEQGSDLNGDPGTAFFTDGSGGTASVTAKNITVAVTDVDKVAAASLAPSAAGGAVSSDGGNADALYQLSLATTLPDGTPSADTMYRKMVVSLGVQASSVTSNLATQTTLSTSVDASRDSAAGVNIDEEMTNMLQFQHAYSAAGKVVSTIQSMMDDLMNMVQG